MIDTITGFARYILTLLFGVFVSASFSGIRKSTKNTVLLSAFCISDLAFQWIVFYTQGIDKTTTLYPLITHLPLFLFLVLIMKKKPLPSLLSVTTAYLCCQICNWISVIPESAKAPHWAVNVTYGIAVIITFLFVLFLISPSISVLLEKPDRYLVPFCIIPVFYYAFDYTATVYTNLLYQGSVVAIEFVPFLLCVCYLIFCVAYFKQYEEKKELEDRNRLVRLKQEQSEKEIETMRRGEKAVALLRHDMRHFLSNIYVYIENGENEKAKEYINEIIKATDKTVNKRYCANETVNMILSSYENVMAENNIEFRYMIGIPESHRISDADVTSILSNALENAVHAVLPLPEEKRLIELNLTEKSGKTLLSLSNTYAVKPKMHDGMPVAESKDHGFGTQSIRYTTEKLNGKCQFSVTDDRFILQIIV